MEAKDIVALAAKHAGNASIMNSSAGLCLQDAEGLLFKGDLEYAKMRAIDSLRYSVGVFHSDYKAACQ